MTAPKPMKSSTALVRVLTLPIMVGTLAGCGFASSLPDAPSNVGGYDLSSQKPPSVTGPQQVKRLPPPPGADQPKPTGSLAKLKSPVEYRTEAESRATQAAAPKLAEALKTPSAPIKAPVAPLPKTGEVPLDQVAFAPLEFEAIEPPTTQFSESEFTAAPIDVSGQTYTPPSYQTTAQNTVVEQPTYQPYDSNMQSVPLDTYVVEGTQDNYQTAQYDPDPVQTTPYASVPMESYAIAAPPSSYESQTYENLASQIAVDQSAPAPRGVSQIAILRSRLPNGAVVNVHPVIGAPGKASSTLARTVVMMVGAPINEAAARNAQAVFDLRGKAERNTSGYVAVEWTLYDASKNVVGVFPERQNGGTWQEMDDGALRAMGQRVADRLARNGELRKATLYAAANPTGGNYAMSPVGVSAPVANTTFVMKRGARLASAPMPRVSPRAATTYSAPVQVAARPAPVVTQPYVRPTPVQPTQPLVITQAPTPLVSPAPVQLIPQSPQIVTQAPRPVAPPPTFDTLRPTNNTQPVAAPTVVATGPRPLVFRGVQGAPGDGDRSLTAQVGKLLEQSGARMAQSAQPGALYLSAQVSKSAAANGDDRIEIIWRVQDDKGTSIGQVTQANNVPRGALDQAWGEDAFYAAQGARDGIMELLQTSGALGA